MADINQLQLKYELKMLEDGAERYENRLEGLKHNYSTATSPHRIITDSLPAVAEALRTVQAQKPNSRGFAPFWYDQITGVDPDRLAYIALRGCFDSVAKGQSVAKVLSGLGQVVAGELWAEGLRAFDLKLYERIESKTKQDHNNIRYRKKAARAIARKAGYDGVQYDAKQSKQVGEPLLNAVLEHTDLFDKVTDQEGYRSRTVYLTFTESARALITQLDTIQAWEQPMFKPMLVRPLNWEAYDTGAYLSDELNSMVPLVRRSQGAHRRMIRKAAEDGSLKPCLDALNAIQSVPFKINEFVLDVVRWCWESNKTLSKFPSSRHLEKQPRPDNWEELPITERKAWTIAARKVLLKNREIDSNCAVMRADLSTAEYLSGFDEFYHPHSLDFRGRVYPIAHFNHQRDDHIKALHTFANGKPIGDNHGYYWLAIHLANVGDFDRVSKASLDARYQWVIENQDKILQVSADPKATFDWWSGADKPFQFVAACREWANYIALGETYVCSLPIALDGSNSGIQHYSASLRSQEDGALVNLIPADKPADIYQAVADHVEKAVQADLAKFPEGTRENRCAVQWLNFGITRKVVKRNVMTYGYSSEQYGFRLQQMEDLMRPLSDKVLSGDADSHPFGEDEGYEAAKYIAGKVWTGVNSVIKAASAGMKFYQQIAAALAHEGKGMRWTTPVGFPVLHKYTDYDVKRVKLYLYDREAMVAKETKVSYRAGPKTKINKSKAKSAVAPNVIHSLDAAHLMLTVNKAAEQGINDVMLIHDSFAACPADTLKFFYTIRSTFVGMYTEYDPFNSIREAAAADLSEENVGRLPGLPETGSLDLSGVIESDYCFA